MRKATYALLVISLFLAAGLFAVDKQLFEFGKAATQAEVQAKGNYQLIVQGSNSTPVNIVLTNLKTWVVDGVSPSNVQSYAVAASNTLRAATTTTSNSLKAEIDDLIVTGGGMSDATAATIAQQQMAAGSNAVSATTLSGDGYNIIELNADNLSYGTVPQAALSGSYNINSATASAATTVVDISTNLNARTNSAALTSLSVSNDVHGEFNINQSGNRLGIDGYGGNMRMFPGSGNSFQWFQSGGNIFSDVWGNNNYYKMLLTDGNFPGLTFNAFGFANPYNKLAEGGVAVSSVGIYGGSGGALADLPIRPEQNAEALEYPPTFVTSWNLVDLVLHQTNVWAQLHDASTNGLLYAFTNQGLPLWYHLDNNVRWLTNSRIAGQLAIDTTAFPAGTNLLRQFQTNGWKFSLTAYMNKMPTNQVLMNMLGQEVVAGVDSAVPATTPNTVDADVKKFYEWGMDMFRGSDVIPDTSYQRYWPRVLANSILNPKDTYYRNYWKDQYQQSGRTYRPMALLWLTPRLGEKDGEAYSQANVVNHDFRDNGYGGYLGDNDDPDQDRGQMKLHRSIQTNEVPKLSKGHYGTGASLFGDASSVMQARWQLTMPMMQWGLINICTRTNQSIQSFMPNIVSQITNAGWVALRKDVYDKCFVVLDNGATNTSVWARRLADQGIAVAIYNEAGSQQSVTLTWDKLQVPDSQYYYVYDIWNKTNMTAYAKTMYLTLASKEVRLLRFYPCEVEEDGWESATIPYTGGYSRSSPSGGTYSSPDPNYWESGLHLNPGVNIASGCRIPVKNWATNVILEFGFTSAASTGVSVWTNLLEKFIYPTTGGRTYSAVESPIAITSANMVTNVSYSFDFPATNSWKVVGVRMQAATNVTDYRYMGPTLRKIMR